MTDLHDQIQTCKLCAPRFATTATGHAPRPVVWFEPAARILIAGQSRFAILPMAFCFPGYNAAGSDLAPPRICAQTWRAQALDMLPNIRLKMLIGGYAMKYHLPSFTTVTQAVADWRDHPAGTFALPHPSWRNTAWLRKNPWFETEVIPRLRAAVTEALDDE